MSDLLCLAEVIQFSYRNTEGASRDFPIYQNVNILLHFMAGMSKHALARESKRRSDAALAALPALLCRKGDDLLSSPRKTRLDRKPFRRVIFAVELAIVREQFRRTVSHFERNTRGIRYDR